MGMFACLLVPMVVYLESLHVQSSITLAPQAIMAPGMHEDPVIFEPLSQIWPSRSTYKFTSYVDFASYMWSFRKFEAYLVNFTNDLNSPDVIKCFREAHTTQLIWERSKIQTVPNHYNCSEAYWCRLLKVMQENLRWSWILKSYIYNIYNAPLME